MNATYLVADHIANGTENDLKMAKEAMLANVSHRPLLLAGHVLSR